MPEAAKEELDAKRQKLLRAKLGRLLFWTPPDTVETVGPFYPAAIEQYDAARSDVIVACEHELLKYSEVEIEALVGDFDTHEELCVNWARFKREKISHLNKKVPPWYAAGMGNLEYRADFDYWSKMPRFSINEVLCLSLGVRPDAFKSAELRKILEGDPSDLWPSLKFMRQQYELLKRTFAPDSRDGSVRSGRFLSWADEVKFEAHPEFIEHLRRLHGKGPAQKALDAKKPDKREIDKIAQLFAAMAIDNLGYDPKASRSPTPKEIADLAAEMGLDVSVDTVRKYLVMGARHIPEDWKPG